MKFNKHKHPHNASNPAESMSMVKTFLCVAVLHNRKEEEIMHAYDMTALPIMSVDGYQCIMLSLMVMTTIALMLWWFKSLKEGETIGKTIVETDIGIIEEIESKGRSVPEHNR